MSRRPPQTELNFTAPKIRTRVPSAPGSASSRRSADAWDYPMQARVNRIVMHTLAAAGDALLSREQVAERSGIKESTLCSRLHTLAPLWVECVEDAVTAASGLLVNGYRLTALGRRCVAEVA